MSISQRIITLLPHDKCLHFIAGIFVYAAAYFFVQLLAIYVVTGVAALKEAWDAYRGGAKSAPDIFATLMGGFAAYCLIVQI